MSLENENMKRSHKSNQQIFADIACIRGARVIAPSAMRRKSDLPGFAAWLSKVFRGNASRIGMCVIVLLVTLGYSDRGSLAQEQDSFDEQEALTKNQVALPDSFSIDVPGKEVSNEFAVFSGAWAGDGWNGIVPIALVVEKIDQTGSAAVIFSWGDVVGAKRPRGWLRTAGRIDQGMLSISIPDYGKADFSLTPDGRLYGRYTYISGRQDYVVLTRVTPADRGKIIAASENMLGWEDVTFPAISSRDNSKSVRLHGLLYRSGVAGRQPLAIVCGDTIFSEGSRARPRPARIKARQMLGLGYSVLVLQRKGMGGSDGPFMEPRDLSVPLQTQLQSALDDLDAAVTFATQQEYVDPSRVVIIGNRRGGLLSVVYAGLHDGAVAGVVNTAGAWKVHRTWWQRLFSWQDFTAVEFADAGKHAKIPMLWVYGGSDAAALESARNSFGEFTRQGGRGTFVDIVAQKDKTGPSSEPAAAKAERALVDYIHNLEDRGGQSHSGSTATSN
jgi:dienelactone hydrolase